MQRSSERFGEESWNVKYSKNDYFLGKIIVVENLYRIGIASSSSWLNLTLRCTDIVLEYRSNNCTHLIQYKVIHAGSYDANVQSVQIQKSVFPRD
jgi:hypothetical protein